MISEFRELFYQFQKPVTLPVPVVSIGNLSMGGTGKTPMTLLLAEELIRRGLRVAVLSRGYGRKISAPLFFSPDDPPSSGAEMGDEPFLLKNRLPMLSLCIHADRANQALKNWNRLGNPQVVLLDDGFQHWKVLRNIDIVLWNAEDSLHSKAIPMGTLREDFRALGRADYFFVTGSCSAKMKSDLEEKIRSTKFSHLKTPPWRKNQPRELQVGYADYQFQGFFSLNENREVRPDATQKVLLVSGIAKPERFHRLMEKEGFKYHETIVFKDHHSLTERELYKIHRRVKEESISVVVTEKDLARWKDQLATLPGFFPRVGLAMENGDIFEKLVKEIVCSI